MHDSIIYDIIYRILLNINIWLQGWRYTSKEKYIKSGWRITSPILLSKIDFLIIILLILCRIFIVGYSKLRKNVLYLVA